MNSPSRQFVVERRSLAPRLYQLYAPAVNDADELRAIADQLGDLPRDWIESWPDLFNAMRRVKGRIRLIADRIDAKATPHPSLPRPSQAQGRSIRRCRAKPNLAVSIQIEMAL